MNTKEIKIVPPKGYEIDKENSTFDCIKFKSIEKRWRDKAYSVIEGYWITPVSEIRECKVRNNQNNYNAFATEKQAKSALAMARISQIMANDERFGGVVTDEEWNNTNIIKYVVDRLSGYRYNIHKGSSYRNYKFLAFHKAEQRDLFLEENEDLVKDYLMI